MKTRRLLPFALIGFMLCGTRSLAASGVQVQACFSPALAGGCDPASAVIREISAAKTSVRVQMYALTSREIVSALVDAKRRGLDVRVVVDRSQLESDQSEAYAVGRLLSADIPVLVDTVPGLMHNKILIVDNETVVTGSFNYTWSAENRNAENLIVIHDSAIAAEYARNWSARAARSRLLAAHSGSTAPLVRNESDPSAGPVRANSKTGIYEWLGCPYYDKVSPRNRVQFPNSQAAEAAGYRPARNCP
jgi:phosphatidylserine/phosphatidylglycerophosphate/cardiolipin synthase-like enzyme